MALGLSGLNLDAAHSTIKFDDGLHFVDNDSFKIDIYDQVGGAIIETHIFDVNTDGTLLLSAPDENGTPPVYVTGVSADITNDSMFEIIGKVSNAMRAEGFTVDIDNNGSMKISAGGQPIVVEVTDLNTSLPTPNITITDDVAGTALDDIENAKSQIGNILTILGTFSNRLESQSKFNHVLTDKLEEGLGILVDVNLAEISAKLQSEQTKEQLGIQSLSIANSASQSIMGLFQ